MKTLGKALKDARELMPLTLRQVEDATGISNAYLCMLENNKIKKPSANILYKLSCIYRVDLNELLYAAGIITEEDSVLKATRANGSIIDGLTPEEKEQLLQYLKFLRHKN